MKDMLDVRLSGKNLTSATNSSLSGQLSIPSDTLRLQEEKECTTMETFIPCFIKNPSKSRKRKSSTVAFPAPIKKKISGAKLHSWNPSTQALWSSKMLGQASTLNHQGCLDYLKMSWILKLRQSLCPTEIDCVDSDLSLLKGFVTREAQKSWYATMTREKDLINLNYPKAFWQSATFWRKKKWSKSS
eukprot:NODE_51_length_27121_cov_0.309452.p11 type:complete len:187 gc:universal NODE_51_length_27121_cov_0.309452:5960-6520(+)